MLLTNKYCHELKSRNGDEFYNWFVKGEMNLKTYARRIPGIASPHVKYGTNTENLWNAFISGLPRVLKGNATASKPQNFRGSH
ncbi:hypothetical protein Tco_0648596 [Tanacetum coccineum]